MILVIIELRKLDAINSLTVDSSTKSKYYYLLKTSILYDLIFFFDLIFDNIANPIRLLIHLLFNFLTAVEYTIFNKHVMH